ncbi:pilus assembly protein PilX [Paracidovorax avenae]|uniref:pilus assembly PilX family protein n=1 Tax=Paracidovorax avenae TaxID=80867 RepID=UPI000D22888A|nr:PilX N-terminal domain-containing pilus assembly protein [Paracidovorax avenae]AVS78598.1 pilus assembly protein PilX [Paracidovorax avenae]
MNRKSHPHEQGVALIVVLLFLVAITGVTVWMVKQSTLSEGIARNQLDQEAARQAAESALRDAERDIMNASISTLPNASCARGVLELNPNDFTADCHGGLCIKDDASYSASDWSSAAASNKTVAEPWWPAVKGGSWNDDFDSKPGRYPEVNSTNCDSFTGGVPLGTYTGVAPVIGVAAQPEYIIEYFRRKNVRVNMAEMRVTSNGENANQWSSMYRITARGFGYSLRTQVVLQTIYFP